MTHPAIASAPEIDALIEAGAPVAIGVSGGKDSQAAALATIAYLNEVGHTGPRMLIHSDLGSVEWNESLPTCECLAAHLGIELAVVRRTAGDLMDRWEQRWKSSMRRYANLETVTLVPCWSTPSLRFCTSELKTHVIAAELKRRFKDQKIINVTGVRRQENAERICCALPCRAESSREVQRLVVSSGFRNSSRGAGAVSRETGWALALLPSRGCVSWRASLGRCL